MLRIFKHGKVHSALTTVRLHNREHLQVQNDGTRLTLLNPPALTPYLPPVGPCIASSDRQRGKRTIGRTHYLEGYGGEIVARLGKGWGHLGQYREALARPL
jgi:hypothetical protein